jgi:hypothetical protein
MIRLLLDLTDGLTDEQLEVAVAQVRAVRLARLETIAYERAMAAATGGLSIRYGEAATPEGRQRELIYSLVRNGLTADQVDRHLASLRPGARD